MFAIYGVICSVLLTYYFIVPYFNTWLSRRRESRNNQVDREQEEQTINDIFNERFGPYVVLMMFVIYGVLCPGLLIYFQYFSLCQYLKFLVIMKGISLLP